MSVTGNLVELNDMLNFIHERKNERGIKQKGGKLYTVVADRVEALRRFGGTNYQIETELLKYDPLNPKMPVLVRATIRGQDGKVLATGHAEEWRDEGYVNKTSAVENAETSAIGRALAGLGLHGGEYASFNEIEIAQTKQGHLAKPTPPKAPEPEPAKAETGKVEVVIPVAEPNTEVVLEIPEPQEDTFFAIAKLFLPDCKSIPELTDFWSKNSGALGELKARDPSTFDKVKSLFTQRKNELTEK